MIGVDLDLDRGGRYDKEEVVTEGVAESRDDLVSLRASSFSERLSCWVDEDNDEKARWEPAGQSKSTSPGV